MNNSTYYGVLAVLLLIVIFAYYLMFMDLVGFGVYLTFSYLVLVSGYVFDNYYRLNNVINELEKLLRKEDLKKSKEMIK